MNQIKKERQTVGEKQRGSGNERTNANGLGRGVLPKEGAETNYEDVLEAPAGDLCPGHHESTTAH